MVVMAKHETSYPSAGSLSGGEATLVADKPSNERADDASREEQIRMRAYELYLERGAEPDDGLEDWLRAEREFRRSPHEPTGPQEAPGGVV
jgi:hypothetical protein